MSVSEESPAPNRPAEARGTVVAYLPERFADWEVGYACSEINKPSTGYRVKTMSVYRAPVRSIGGWTVTPDLAADERALPSDMRLLILVGGETWNDPANLAAAQLVDAALARGVPVAAICGACTFLAEHGFLDDCDHTGNADYEFARMAPRYRGQAHFRAQPVVDGGTVITANGAAGIEFACAIFARLGIEPWGDLAAWRDAFKRGSFVA